tara:strand:+ start:2425 stop:2529 length:105 start_codon:yes stop_codon:yes gene_type:complete
MVKDIPKWAATIAISTIVASGILFLAGSIMEALI